MIETLLQSAEFQQLAAHLQRGARVVSLAGLSLGPARAVVLAALQRATGRCLALVAPANRDLEAWEADLRFWHGALNDGAAGLVVTLPAAESDPYAGASPHAELLEERALALWQLARERPAFALLTAQSLAQRTFAPDELRRAGAFLQRDEDCDLHELRDKLLAAGYVREDPVGAMGEFSLRGGILDVWPPGRESPVRVEFFGDTVDSLREFDPATQLSVAHLKTCELPPMRELAVGADDFQMWAELARETWAGERFARALRDRTAYADDGESFTGWEWLMPLLHEPKSSVFDYLRDAVLVVDEPSAVENHLSQVYDTLAARHAHTDAADELGLPPETFYLAAEELRDKLNARPRLELRALGRAAAETDDSLKFEIEDLKSQISNFQSPISNSLFLFPLAAPAPEINWTAQSVRRYHGRWPDVARDLQRRREEGAFTLLLTHTHGMAERVRELLADYGVRLRLGDAGEIATTDEPALIAAGPLSGGFALPAARLEVFVERDLFDEANEGAAFGQDQRPKTKGRKSNAAAFLSDFRDVKPGDFVVHIDHGIGRFGGLQTLDMQGRSSEFMLLFYADDAKLFVPVERLDLVQRYSSAEGHQPSLDRLGGLGWQKTKAKAKRAMRDLADELLRLYAERKLVTGHAFASDSPWQDEFEAAFEYEPTPDQATAIEDVKRDMETTTPMDRLLCGDVGYGKTEVAMRAAFKAVMEGKQVAVLTPTTILAYQHFETFRHRFAAFPVKVELLSRLRSAKEQKEVVKDLAAGRVDIIVGTHRILSKDIGFKDLGLVVVDEEQRFGVAHKERLKKLRKKVDVLTLSATPIPRTLNMSLMGLRDMSVIETPPRDRLAIQTQVVPSSENVIKAAIELELGRGGQVFFIHNRVESIDAIAALVQKIAPTARVAVGHGQMNEKRLEDVMMDFVHYQYDVLVATTIIENGIDIPRANTIIINRADAYGLSQLYQLRGRVGRSNRRAYAYLLIPGEQTLTPIARRRLAAIREFSDLGAGFRIAALDLELRGAGNLLGGQQSGHLDALGFDLYAQMLERTVQELRGEAIEDEPSVSINLGVDVAIPDEYVADMSQRLRAYKRIASARDDDALYRVRDELNDRYGRLPASVENLFEYARLRRLAEQVGAVSLDRTNEGLAVKLHEKARVAPEKLLELVSQRPGATFTPNGVLRVALDKDEREDLLTAAGRLLAAIQN